MKVFLQFLSNSPLIILFFFLGCNNNYNSADSKKTLHISAGSRITTLDPALASDLVSSYIAASFYDTLVQYDYTARPYTLIPSMLDKMPGISDDQTIYRFRLRNDLFFQDKSEIRDDDEPANRKISSRDVVFSFLRLADARLHSTGFWLIRGKIKGLASFHEKTLNAPKNDYSPYDESCEGFKILDNLNFEIHLEKPDPRFLYCLAMPYMSVVSEKIARHYGNDLSENTAGSGPFILAEWMRDYRIILDKNPEYRKEFFPEAEAESERQKQLPLLDRIVCYLVKQPVSGWLLFLQGELDLSVLDKDNLDAVMMKDTSLSPALSKRGIKMIKIPEFQINYIGFSFTDPLLASNLDLRKAISLAFDINKRIVHSNYCLVPVEGPIPPGVAGYDPDFINPYNLHNLDKSKEYLKKAGFQDGINPATGLPLEFEFDLGDTGSFHRQSAELMAEDMKNIGIKIKPCLNNKPRFFQKLKEGKMQLFRLSWIGDYPDAENFLQLFYGLNAGSCNRTQFQDSKFDKLFEEIKTMPECPERTEKYRIMAEYLTSQCPWIFESRPLSFRLVHKWVMNYIPHNFPYTQWKYLSVDPVIRNQTKNNFTPLNLKELK